MDVVLLWTILAVCVGIVARARGRSGLGWWLFSMFLTPLLGFIMVALLPSRKPPAPGGETPTPDTHVKCPDCAEFVRMEARVCKHCGCKLVPQNPAPAPRDAWQ